MFRFISTMIITSFVLLLLIIQCGKKVEVVAKVENQEITVEELRKVLESQFRTTDLSAISFENKQKTLNELIDQRLKELKAKSLGLDQDPDFLHIHERKENQVLYRKLNQIEIIDKFVPNNLVKKYFNWQKLEVSAVNIIIGFRGTVAYKANRTFEEATKRASEVIEKLKKIQNPSEVAIEYSDDPSVKRNSGIIDPYPIGRYSPKADEAVFSAEVGDIVGPFSTRQGSVVFKIIKKRERIGKSDFDAVKEQFRQRLYRAYFAEQANQKRHELTDKFREKYNAKIFENNIAQFFHIIQEWNKNPKYSDSDFTEEQRKLPLAEINNKSITVGTVVDQFQGRFYRNYIKYNSQKELQSLINQILDWDAWITEAKNRKLQQRADVRKEVEDFSSIQLARLLDQKEIREKVEVTEDDISSKYEENKNKYLKPESIQIWEIALKEENLASNIAKRARSGENFENLAKKYAEKKELQNSGGYLGFQTRQTAYPEVVEKAFKAGANKITGPFKYGIYYYVIKTGKYLPPRQQKLEEVKAMIQSGIRNNKENDRRRELMEQIRKEYSFHINDSILRSIS